ncbi:hypothetical protein [Candidatus Amoebophilus asiaticus]|uniref:hypothetical protein n=1 Tax=Candidatus Amoebophilus asiaticus TaxID=281120 RepID=UPI001650278E|nr:hypothetical protein [Candidatus Amoebophilus asiaticus]
MCIFFLAEQLVIPVCQSYDFLLNYAQLGLSYSLDPLRNNCRKKTEEHFAQFRKYKK